MDKKFLLDKQQKVLFQKRNLTNCKTQADRDKLNLELIRS